MWLLLALILRRPVTSWLPLLGAFAVVLVNELVDLWVEVWPERGMQAGEAGKDLLTTMAVPLMLLLAFRSFPGLTARRPSAAKQGEAPAAAEPAE